MLVLGVNCPFFRRQSSWPSSKWQEIHSLGRLRKALKFSMLLEKVLQLDSSAKAAKAAMGMTASQHTRSLALNTYIYIYVYIYIEREKWFNTYIHFLYPGPAIVYHGHSLQSARMSLASPFEWYCGLRDSPAWSLVTEWTLIKMKAVPIKCWTCFRVQEITTKQSLDISKLSKLSQIN